MLPAVRTRLTIPIKLLKGPEQTFYDGLLVEVDFIRVALWTFIQCLFIFLTNTVLNDEKREVVFEYPKLPLGCTTKTHFSSCQK